MAHKGTIKQSQMMDGETYPLSKSLLIRVTICQSAWDSPGCTVALV